MLPAMPPAAAIIAPTVATAVIPLAPIATAIAGTVIAAITHTASIVMPSAIVSHVGAAMIHALAATIEGAAQVQTQHIPGIEAGSPRRFRSHQQESRIALTGASAQPCRQTGTAR